MRQQVALDVKGNLRWARQASTVNFSGPIKPVDLDLYLFNHDTKIEASAFCCCLYFISEFSGVPAFA